MSMTRTHGSQARRAHDQNGHRAAPVPPVALVPPVPPIAQVASVAQVAQPSGGARQVPRGGRHERRDWARDLTPTGRTAAVEDARLLLIPRGRGRLRSLYPRLVFVALGYAAITSLGAAYAEAVPLPVTALLVVIPAVTCVVATGMRNPLWGRRALVGWLAGIVATIIYDALRLALVQVGIWGDPIPTIGRLALADPHANFVWGYLWRFMGNGGGMGIACAMLPWRGVRAGIAYGTLVCSGLFAVLLFFPVAQAHLVPLTR